MGERLRVPLNAGVSAQMAQPEIPVPDYNDPKELYAFYGLASYTSQLFEHSVLNLAAVLRVNKVRDISQDTFDEAFQSLDRFTLGQLVKAARSLMNISEELDVVFDDALERRNYLAHHFFREHSESLLHDTGRRTMIDELRMLIRQFQEADRKITPIYLALWERYGITEERIEDELAMAKKRMAQKSSAH